MRWLAFLFCVMATANAADPFEGLEADVSKALKAHGAPGVGVSVIRDGNVILSRGFGVKVAGKPAPVTKDTLFAIGSVSKSFTAALIAMLVEEKKMRWDDPVRKYLPTFQMQDRYLSEEVTIRDCLSHRVGMPRNDLVWYGTGFGRDEVLSRVRRMKYDTRIRTTFVYNNILYLAAGQCAAKAAGQSWDELIVKRFFEPLGMETANTSITKFRDDDDVATPHTKVKGKPKAVAWRNADNVGPAGSINASAAEMAKYALFQLSKGKAGSKRILDKNTFEVMHQPQIFLARSTLAMNGGARHNAYGLGWFLSEWSGTPIIEHGGNLDGMTASVILVPEKKIGVVVLANLNGSALPSALGLDIIDRLLGNEPKNLAYTSSLIAFASEYAVQVGAVPDEKTRIKDTKPSFELEKYAGTYQDDLHSPVVAAVKNGKMTLTFNSFILDGEHWHYDTFAATERTGVLPKSLFTFDQSSEGGVAALRFSAAAGELRFKKVK